MRALGGDPRGRDRRRRAPRRSPRARAAPRAWPTGCSSASATSPRCAAPGASTPHVAREALDLLEVDDAGLDRLDREILQRHLPEVRRRPGGAVHPGRGRGRGADTIEDVYEPYLLQQGFVMRTPRGRVATDAAFAHLGLERPPRRVSGSSRCPRLSYARGNLSFRRAPTLRTSCPASSARTAETAASPRNGRPASRAARVRARSVGSASSSSCSTTTTRRPTRPSSSSTSRRRLIGTGRGARELTGLGDLDVIGRPVKDVLGPRVRER